MADHGRRITAAGSPLLAEFAAMDMDQRWLSRSPQTMLETFHWFRGEGFGLIIDDLLRLPPEPAVIAEGFRLLPGLVAPLLGTRDRAVWLLPTPEFRRHALSSRGSLWEIASRTTDPERALSNLLERDRLFTERLREETRSLGLRVIDVDTTVTEDDLDRQVSGALRLAGPEPA